MSKKPFSVHLAGKGRLVAWLLLAAGLVALVMALMLCYAPPKVSSDKTSPGKSQAVREEMPDRAITSAKDIQAVVQPRTPERRMKAPPLAPWPHTPRAVILPGLAPKSGIDSATPDHKGNARPSIP